MLKPGSRFWPLRSSTGMLLALACSIVLGIPSSSRGEVTTLRHTYRFDASGLRIQQSPTGARIVAPGFAATWEADSPEIPFETLTFLVPRGTRGVAVRAVPRDDVVMAEAVQLRPAGAIEDTEGRWLDPSKARQAIPAGAAAAPYGTYPLLAAEIAGGGAVHGYQLLTVRVYPVHFEAASGRVRVTPAYDLEIDLESGGGLPLERQRYSAAIEADARRGLERLVANPEAIGGYDRRIGIRVDKGDGGFHPTDAPSLEGSDVDYVIVTTDALAPSWQVLADWKTRRGVPTVVRTVEWLQANYRRGSDVQETIRTFLQDAYAKWAVRYVLLAGDTDLLPARYGYSAFGEATERDIPSDMYFACLDGNWNKDGDHLFGEAAISVSDPGDSTDLYAEVYVGRAPFSTTTEVAAWIGKLMTYENPVDTAYQNKVLMLGEVLFPVDWEPGQSISMDGASFCEEFVSYMSGCVSTTRLYENYTAYPGSLELTLAATLAQINTGYGLVNHVGHGSRYNMSCGDASLQNFHTVGLTNGNKRGVLYMLNCTATAFDFPCLAEAFMDASGGMVAVLGASRAAYALPSRNYNRGFVQALYQNGYEHLGEVFVQSRLSQTPNAWFDTADHYSHLLYNFMGDPEMVMHTCTLGATVASYPASIGLGTTNVVVNVTVGGVAREGALVCLQKGTEEYEFATTDALGNATLPFRAESAGSVQVTVSGQNMTTHLGSMTVTNGGGPYVSVQSLSLSDDNSGASLGNSDGVLDAGETIELTVTFTNSGNSTASTLTGKLRIPSPNATVLDSTYSLANISPGGTATATLQVVFNVPASVADGAVLPLTFVTTNGSATWTDVVNKVVHAPNLKLTRLVIADPGPGGNNDGVIQAGETFNLIPYWKNYGTGAADGLVAALSSGDPHVVITTVATTVGRLNPMQELTGTPALRLTETVLEENLLTFHLVDSHSRDLVSDVTLRGPAPPASPALDASVGAGVIIVTWTPSAVADLAGYHVYQGLSPSGPWTRVTVDRLARTAYYRSPGLNPATLYSYYVTTVDSSGNESQPSGVTSINTQPAQLAGWPIGLSEVSSCSPAVGDITGDGSKEILAGNAHLYAWNWDGSELRDDDGNPQTWGVFANEIKTITGALAVGELDPSSPGFEVFATVWDDSNKAFIVRGDGSFPPNWPRNPDFTTVQKGYWGDSAVMDLDGDGVCEVFAPAKNGNLYAWHADGTPLGAAAAFKTGLGTYMRCSPSFANIDGDPEREIIFGAANGVLHIWNPDGSNAANFPKTVATATLANTAVGDINKDGILDVVYITEGGALSVINTKTGNQLPGWPKSLSVKSSAKSPSPALADLDNDGFLEIVVANNAFPTAASAVQVYNHLGAVLPGWPILTGGITSESSPIVADVSGDGVPDILFGNEGGLLYGWTMNGQSIPGFPLTVGDFIRSVPVAEDVDGDGNINLVLSGWDKNVYVWNFTAPYSRQAAQWPMLKHDSQRSGLYGYRIDEPTDVGDGGDPAGSPPPPQAVLAQNVPNPFNPTTRIDYGVPQQAGKARSDVALDIYDAQGRHIRRLLHGTNPPGRYSAVWDGRNDRGLQVPSGVYFYRLHVEDQVVTRKMLLLK